MHTIERSNSGKLADRDWFRRAITVLAALAALLQVVVLVLYSLNKFAHFDLTTDFAIASQASWLIAHGHLNPFNTLYQDRFWQDQFNLIMWPLGLLRVLFPSGLTLLVVQALALGATSFVIIRFTIELAKEYGLGTFTYLAVVGGVALLTLFDPWLYEAASFDVHMETVGTLFLVIALRGLWRHQRFIPWIAIGLVLTAGSAMVIDVAALGVGMLLIPRLRRPGIIVAASGIVITLAILMLHAHQGTSIVNSYGYLAQSHSLKPSTLAIG
ncbi:MAG: hypothetical protein ACYDHP_13510, partial [Ferrimicrobium sp.]